jgi:hypothetical protein
MKLATFAVAAGLFAVGAQSQALEHVGDCIESVPLLQNPERCVRECFLDSYVETSIESKCEAKDLTCVCLDRARLQVALEDCMTSTCGDSDFSEFDEGLEQGE